jgi:hypothetical protein
MNCFNNNRPKLSASDRIKNRKAQAMFKANVMDYQIRSTRGKGKCSNYKGNVGFYTNGKLRKTENFETLMNINRGSALCVDGAYKQNCLNLEDERGIEIKKGLNACGRNSNVKITLGRDNVYTIFSGFKKIITSINDLFSGFPVLRAYKFDSSNGSFVNDPSYNTIPSDFDLNLNNPKDSLVVIDPKNELFGSNFCSTDMDNKSQGPNKYLKHSSVNKFIVAEGQIFTPAGVGPTSCDSNTNVPVFEHLVGFGDSFVKTSDLTKSQGIGYVFKKCCGTGPNGESNWWTIYIRPLLLVGNNPEITSFGFYTYSGSVSLDIIMGFKTTAGVTRTPLITSYGAGDPCKRNLQSGNNSQQNYLITYGVTSNKTRFNVNPNVYKLTNTEEYNQVSSNVTVFTPTPTTTLTDFSGLYRFNENVDLDTQENGLLNYETGNRSNFTKLNLTEGGNAFNSVRTSQPFNTTYTYDQLRLRYDSGFDINTENDPSKAGITLLMNENILDQYRSVIFKLEKNGNSVNFRGKKYFISNNKFPLKKLLLRSNLMKKNVVDNLFDDSNNHYIGMVYNEGTNVKHLLGNLKINGKLTNNCTTNWLTTSKEITPLFYSQTKDSNFGTMDGDDLIVNNTLTSDIWIILMFRTETNLIPPVTLSSSN